ncbi:MAG: response regulator [Chloroflexi bacterium]|nr:response regulator [Chloroflexota bacterium]
MPAPAKILVVDDDPDFVEATRIVLESASYCVVVANDGVEALKRAGEEQPDLIILDVIMPLQDGFVTCAELKKSPEFEGIPVLMLTSFTQNVSNTSLSVQQGLMLEADDFVDKPVAPQELLARVGRLLRQHASLA